MYKRSEKERLLAKENQKLLKNIKRRFANLERKYGSTIAIETFRKRNIPLTTRGLSLKDLQQQHRNLTYISSLKTSTVKGQKQYEKSFKPIENALKDTNVSDKFFELYNKFIEENRWMEKYKYEIFDTLLEEINENKSDEEIFNSIKEKINDLETEDIIENYFYGKTTTF